MCLEKKKKIRQMEKQQIIRTLSVTRYFRTKACWVEIVCCVPSSVARERMSVPTRGQKYLSEKMP